MVLVVKMKLQPPPPSFYIPFQLKLTGDICYSPCYWPFNRIGWTWLRFVSQRVLQNYISVQYANWEVRIQHITAQFREPAGFAWDSRPGQNSPVPHEMWSNGPCRELVFLSESSNDSLIFCMSLSPIVVFYSVPVLIDINHVVPRVTEAHSRKGVAVCKYKQHAFLALELVTGDCWASPPPSLHATLLPGITASDLSGHQSWWASTDETNPCYCREPKSGHPILSLSVSTEWWCTPFRPIAFHFFPDFWILWDLRLDP